MAAVGEVVRRGAVAVVNGNPLAGIVVVIVAVAGGPPSAAGRGAAAAARAARRTAGRARVRRAVGAVMVDVIAVGVAAAGAVACRRRAVRTADGYVMVLRLGRSGGRDVLRPGIVRFRVRAVAGAARCG